MAFPDFRRHVRTHSVRLTDADRFQRASDNRNCALNSSSDCGSRSSSGSGTSWPARRARWRQSAAIRSFAAVIA
ncbi:hypothetical protein [Aureimonas sp. ME7]|uniref:hypothetical protein n=1 Tax=Aureimonas sp. ME7 TaxID=2744252 RepID=UPI0015FB9C48|nr:hypothetical protein [Aureimonas sp. ME7]